MQGWGEELNANGDGTLWLRGMSSGKISMPTRPQYIEMWYVHSCLRAWVLARGCVGVASVHACVVCAPRYCVLGVRACTRACVRACVRVCVNA